MFPSCSTLKKLVATSAIVTLLTLLQNVTGANLAVKTHSVAPLPGAADSEPSNQIRRSPGTNVATDDGYARPKRHAHKGYKWFDGVVPYMVDPKFTRSERVLLSKGFQEYAKKTCIRFVPKKQKHKDYVEIQRSDDTDVCGRASLCRQGGMQAVTIGTECMKLRTVLHELGHSICMAHEHERRDRDDFIHLAENVDKYNHNFGIAGSDLTTTLGLMYDYESVMHYKCSDFFKPKSTAVQNCGNVEELSFLDAEKINSLYNCGGCYSYRFRPEIVIQHPPIKKYVANAGFDVDGKRLGVCRGYFNGDIVPGEFKRGERECVISWGHEEHKLTKNFEVLTLPQPKYYSWVSVKGSRIPKNAVPGGREIGGIPLYIGRCSTDFNGNKTRIPGHIRDGKFYFSLGGKERTCEEYEVFVCGRKS